MPTTIDALQLRAVLGRREWSPPRPFGADGWSLTHLDGGSVIVTCAHWDFDGAEWVHASIAHRDRTPDYDDLLRLHRGVWAGKGYAFQVFAPDGKHIDGLGHAGHPNALHLWGRLDGVNPLPDFGQAGVI